MNMELAIPEGQNVIAANVDDKDFAELSTSSKFLGRLQLMSSSSEAVKEGKIACGHWAIVAGESCEDIGTETRGFVVAMRLKAMDVDADPVVAYYDPKCLEFQTIKARSEVENQGPLAGPEFLIYLANEKRFCTLYMCSKTMRREAPAVRGLLRKAATFKITLIKNKKFSWHGPVVTACSATLAGPDQEELKRVLTNFLNPPKSEVEKADDKEAAATSRER